MYEFHTIRTINVSCVSANITLVPYTVQNTVALLNIVRFRHNI